MNVSKVFASSFYASSLKKKAMTFMKEKILFMKTTIMTFIN